MAEDAFATQDGRATPAPSAIATLLASVRDAGGERFDAVGWHYLDSLSKRAARQEGSVRHMLEAKIEQATAAFSARLLEARSIAAALVEAGCTAHPEAAGELHKLFAESDFKGVRRLGATLEARKQRALLGELVTRFEPALVVAAGTLPHTAAARIVDTPTPALELKTVRESRASWARMSVDKQLAMAMDQAPRNAGPINSHMLILRALAMMRDISPGYLGQTVSYIDTLLALDPREAEAPAKKRGASPKAGKASKAAKK